MADDKRPPRTVFDVTKPGKGGLPASSTTRPVIITNRPVIKDPMVNEQTPESAVTATPSNKKLTITPIHDDVAPKAESAEEPMPNITVDDKPVEVTPETTVADVAPEGSQPVAIPAEGEEREAENELARKRAARLQKMIDEEEYFLPIKTEEERRSRKVAIIGIALIVVLAAAWYNTALDAGLLPNSYDLPHTSFFTVK